MRKLALGTAMAALVLAAGPTANAQLLFHPKAPPRQPSSSEMTSMCGRLKTMPNPPMTYDQCMQMTAAQQSMQAAQNDPSGMRPGDDAMTCDQIKAEFIANGGLHVDQAQSAQSQAATKNFIAKNNQIEAEGAAMMAAEAATSAAAAAARYTPMAGPAAAAVQAQQAADRAVLGAQAQKELVPAQRQMLSSSVGTATNITAQMQANPRQARLTKLAQDRNCQLGAGFSGRPPAP